MEHFDYNLESIYDEKPSEKTQKECLKILESGRFPSEITSGISLHLIHISLQINKLEELKKNESLIYIFKNEEIYSPALYFLHVLLKDPIKEKLKEPKFPRLKCLYYFYQSHNFILLNDLNEAFKSMIICKTLLKNCPEMKDSWIKWYSLISFLNHDLETVFKSRFNNLKYLLNNESKNIWDLNIKNKELKFEEFKYFKDLIIKERIIRLIEDFQYNVVSINLNDLIKLIDLTEEEFFKIFDKKKNNYFLINNNNNLIFKKPNLNIQNHINQLLK